MAPGFGLTRNTSAQSIWRMHLMTCINANPWSPSHLEQNETTDTCQTALVTRSKQNRRLVNMPFGHEGECKQGDSRVRQDQPQHCEKPQAMPLTRHVRVTNSKSTPLTLTGALRVQRQAARSLLDTDGLSELDCLLCPRGTHRRIRNLRLVQLHSKSKDSLKKKFYSTCTFEKNKFWK